MPTYDYRCAGCENSYTARLSMKDCNIPQPCPECGEMGDKVPSVPQIIFKGDGWMTKNGRVSAQMKEKNRRLDARQQEMKRETNVGGTLVPNVNGERVDSWSDAQKLAKDKGKNADSYTTLVEKEKR